MGFRFGSTILVPLFFFYLPAAYADDVSEGRNLFLRKCLGCHAFACDKEGPRLGGLFGRKAASVANYKNYSQDMQNAEIVWSAETLDAFFAAPEKVTPDGVMASNGKIEDADQRRQLIAFLKTEDPMVSICPQ